MARARNIKPGILKNEVLGVADPLYTLLFEGLWLLADRSGRLEDRPLRIKAEVFPYREGLDIGTMLGWLQTHGFVRRYVVNGLALIQITNFEKHQNPHKNEPPSQYEPPPEEIGTTSEEIGSARADSGFLIPDSGLLIPALPPLASVPPAAPALAPKPKGKTPKPPKMPIPDDFAISPRVEAWAVKKGFDRLPEHLESFVSKCKAKAYENVSWDDAFMEAIREDWAKLRVVRLDRRGSMVPASVVGVTVPSDGPDKTQRYLESQKLTPEEKAASDAVRRALMPAIKRIA